MPTPPGISPCSIKVIGVGGGGGNTINRMASVAGAGGFLEFVAVNTDVQALAASQADVRVQIGDDGARGLGAGGIPAVGRASAISAEDDLYPIVAGVDMVFVTAGMGGGTGSGAAPVVAELAKSAGCLTVGIVTKPFSFEGQRRMNQALEAIVLARPKALELDEKIEASSARAHCGSLWLIWKGSFEAVRMPEL